MAHQGDRWIAVANMGIIDGKFKSIQPGRGKPAINCTLNGRRVEQVQGAANQLLPVCIGQY